MAVSPEELRRKWDDLWTRLGVRVERVPAFDTLLTAYQDPSRSYHNLGHIVQCLRELDQLRAHCDSPESVELAIWYHDVVYDPTRHDNEERSADLAADGMKGAGLPDERILCVVELIHATKHTHPPITRDAQILADIDLSILGREPEAFDAYERGVRQEYAHVDDRAFREGRAAILRRFLARPSLFSTPPMRDHYESSARQNLQRSLARLQGGAQ
jgi:predicted metal-dependent HD superfamily phosphohydrolase